MYQISRIFSSQLLLSAFFSQYMMTNHINILIIIIFQAGSLAELGGPPFLARSGDLAAKRLPPWALAALGRHASSDLSICIARVVLKAMLYSLQCWSLQCSWRRFL